MAGKGALVVLAAAGFICLLLAAPSEGVVTCGQVAGSVSGCLGYIRGAAPLTSACCSGVRALNAAARTTPDRQTACNCLKRFVNLPGLNFQRAAGLPSQCGVSVPYPISPSTDCSRVR